MNFPIYFFCFFSFISLFFQGSASASVVMTNTRIIYPNNVQETTVQLTNNDMSPNVVQVWTDNGDAQSTPDTANGPFLALPAIFKIEPKRGQLIRLIYTGGELPKDRESIFYFNFLQVPSLPKSDRDENKMVLMLKNRIKVFYRPVEMPFSSDDIHKHISFSVKYAANGLVVEVDNSSSFYASLIDAKIISGKQELIVPLDMVEPKSNMSIEVRNEYFVLTYPMTVEFILVNDFGGHVRNTYIIDKPDN